MLFLFAIVVFNGCGIFTNDISKTTKTETSHKNSTGKLIGIMDEDKPLVNSQQVTNDDNLQSPSEIPSVKKNKSDRTVEKTIQVAKKPPILTLKSILKHSNEKTSPNKKSSIKKVTFSIKDTENINKNEIDSSKTSEESSLSSETDDFMPSQHILPSVTQETIPDESKSLFFYQKNEGIIQSPCYTSTKTSNGKSSLHQSHQSNMKAQELNPSGFEAKNLTKFQAKKRPKFNGENEYDKFNRDLKEHMHNFFNRKLNQQTIPHSFKSSYSSKKDNNGTRKVEKNGTF